ncbi:hypothetical protein NE686_17165 [Tissierella carlieri]|uniref:Uncharacterized protein n=1 Tax=Tissierella carlieri TaxID=689904 RepID=A0ABT1SEF2_9FIRM|nr:hypothetical protein [Tissierella carlieri]MCQ4924835.1 hypothetical protein [Tissierella carlieri]
MLIYQDKDVKIYATNNLLLVLKGDSIEKQIHIEDKNLLEEEALTITEKMNSASPIVKKAFAVAR